MKFFTLLFTLLLSAVSTPAASAAEDAATLCPAVSQSAAQPASDLEKTFLTLGRGGVQYRDSGCTAFFDCPSGQRITCMGANNCGITTTSCSSQGSTCPDQGGSVGAVRCNGSIQASCPCPEVCFGCGRSCRTSADCSAVCTCGSGFCSGGSCICPF